MFIKIKNQKISINFILPCFVVAGILLFSSVLAASQKELDISAYIINQKNKELANGDHEVRFAIYITDRKEADAYPSNSDQGEMVWEETQTIRIQNGILNATLGTKNLLPDNLTFSGQDYYLGIRIDSDSEMVPRKKMTAVPLAVNSSYLNGVTLGSGEGDIPQLGHDSLLSKSFIPKITKLGKVSAGKWEGDNITNNYITDALSGKTYNGLDLTSNSDGFSIEGGNTSRILSVIGADITLNQNLSTDSSPVFSGLTLSNMNGVLKASSGVISGSATTSDLSEGTNLYYTDARARASISATGALSYSSATGVINLNAPIPIAYGGTNATSIGSAGSVSYSTGSAYAFSDAGISGQVLVSSGTGAPTWGTVAGGTIAADSLDMTELKDTLTLDANLLFDSSASNYSFNFDSGTLFVNSANDRVGIGTTAPTALLHLKAGTATASTAPLKFTSGTLNTTAEAGAVEFLTDAYYGTITTGATRKTFAFLESPVFTGTVTLPTPFTLGATSVTSTGTQLNYLNGATGTTGTTSTNLVFSTSPTLVTPALGTPTALVLTNATGLPAASILAGTFGTGAYTMDTSLTVPTVLGGTATTSDLNLKTTSGVGATGADMHFLVGNNGATEAMTILNSGSVGIGTTSPTSLLALGGTVARTIQMERNTTVATAGQGLTLYSGGAITGTADLVGGDLTLKSGTSTGTGTSAIHFYTATAGTTGTADNAPTEKMTILGSGNIGIGTATPGEKLEINYGNLKINLESAPSSMPTSVVNPIAGNLNGQYGYSVTFITATGETERGLLNSSSLVAPVNQQVNISNIPIGGSNVIARNIYRWLYSVSGRSRLVTTINDNTTTTYTDNIADASLGVDAPAKNTTGRYYTSIGGVFEANSLSTFLGQYAGNAGRCTTSTGIGVNALYSGGNNGSCGASVALGNNALYSLVGGAYNTAIGNNALYSATGISQNTAVGYDSLYTTSSGGQNAAVGYMSLRANTTGVDNAALGYYAGGAKSSSGSRNTLVGSLAGYGAGSYDNNSLFGYRSGYALSTGSNNILLGYQAGDAITTGANNILLGYNIDTPATNTNNYLSIGNLIFATGGFGTGTTIGSGNVGIGTTAPTALLHLNGTAGTVPLEINSNETTTTNNVLMLRSDVASADDAVFRVQANGAVYADGAYTGTGADYAEYFATQDTDLGPGETVCVDTQKENAVKRCVRSGDNDVMGIVSQNPSVIGNNSQDRENDPNYKVIAMLGQINGNATNENGPIQIGDSLTPASAPGYLRKADSEESTVGVALQNFNQTKGSIQIMISRRNKSLTVEKVEEAVSQRITDMNVEDQVNKIVDNATGSLTKNIETKLATLNNKVYNLEEITINYEINSKLQEELNDLFKKQLAELQNKTNVELNIAQLDLNTNDISYLKQLLGVDTNKPGDISILGKFTAQVIETGALNIAVKDETKKTIGTAFILPKPVDEDKDGVDDLTKKPVIESDGKSVIIKTGAVKEDSKVFVTFQNNPEAHAWVEKIKNDDGIYTGFKIRLDASVAQEVKADWWIVMGAD